MNDGSEVCTLCGQPIDETNWRTLNVAEAGSFGVPVGTVLHKDCPDNDSEEAEGGHPTVNQHDFCKPLDPPGDHRRWRCMRCGEVGATLSALMASECAADPMTKAESEAVLLAEVAVSRCEATAPGGARCGLDEGHSKPHWFEWPSAYSVDQGDPTE